MSIFTIDTLNTSKGADIASATTTNIWAATGNYVDITGTVAITSFGTAPKAGAWRILQFDGILTLTNGANLIVPGGDRTTVAGDTCMVIADTTTIHRILWYQRASDNILASVHRNGVNQTAIVTATFTKVLFTTELFDIGAKFDSGANSRWTPGVVGFARIQARVGWDTTTDANPVNIAIYKNGAILNETEFSTGGINAGFFQGLPIAALVEVDAVSDFFEIFVQQTSGGNRDINGGIVATWAMFEMVK